MTFDIRLWDAFVDASLDISHTNTPACDLFRNYHESPKVVRPHRRLSKSTKQSHGLMDVPDDVAHAPDTISQARDIENPRITTLNLRMVMRICKPDVAKQVDPSLSFCYKISSETTHINLS
jgi:hypothetical protein